MSPNRTCPDCGANLPDDSPKGLCPRCLMGAALSGTSVRGPAATVGHGVLDHIAQTIGAVPRILLRDTAPGEPSGPIVRPSGGDDDGSIRFRIDGEIARGGMGAVLKGRDPDLGRDVAIKVLREDMRGNPDVVRRFVEEAQIGGQLQHPGIVPIYELGTFPDQRPFFSMKLVKGHTLTALLGSRVGAGDDRPRLLGIFASIAQTVAYAHARGVIHRDLKPSNVMVGAFGEVQVMDWGLAKVLRRGGVVDDVNAGRTKEDTVIATARSGTDVDLSQAGSILGTPSYMAPEQARGEVEILDERCDVFALGSILCEILTGEPAFTGRSSWEIVRKAARGDTAPALERLQACEADAELVTLAGECLATEIEDRPHDASSVATRITAYLASVQDRLHLYERDRAVAEAQAVEERRRRRLQVGLAASVLALASLGFGGYTWVERQRVGRAAAAASAIDDALAEAQRLRGEAQAAEDPDAASSRWSAALAAMKRADDLARQGDADPSRRGRITTLTTSLEAGRREADERAARRKADRVLLATLETTRGGFAEHEDPTRTDAEYAAAFRNAGLDLDNTDASSAGKWLAARASPAELVSYLDDWAARRRTTGRPEPDWRRLVSAARAADPDPWRDAIRARFGATDDASLAELHRLAGDEKALDAQPVGSLVLLARQLSLTLKDRELAADVLRRGVRRFPEDFWAHAELALTGEGYIGVIRADEAIRHLTSAMALRPQSMFVRGKLGWFYAMLGRFEEAELVHREQIRLRPDVASGYIGMSVVRYRQLRTEEAAEYVRKAVELDPMNGVAHTELGVILTRLGNPVEGFAAYQEGIRLNPRQPWVHGEVVNRLAASGQTDKAIASVRSLIRMSPDYPWGHTILIDILATQDKLDAVTSEYRAAVEARSTDSILRMALAHALTKAGKTDAAIVQLEQAVRLQPENPWTHAALGARLVAKQRLYEAELEYREAVRLQPDAAPNCVALSALLVSRGKIDEAILVARDIQRFWDRPEGRNALNLALAKLEANDESIAKLRVWITLDPTMISFRTRLLVILRTLNRTAEADAEFHKALKLQSDSIRNLVAFGKDLRTLGCFDEAITAFREAIRLAPAAAEAHIEMGLLLGKMGRYGESVAELRNGHGIGAKRPDWKYPSAKWLADAERALALSERIPAILKGDDRPATTGDRLAIAMMLYDSKRFASSSRFFADAFKADPRVVEDRIVQNRYNAACAAALANAGQGRDEAKPTPEERETLRGLALTWLRAELDAWRKFQKAGGEPEKRRLAFTLKHWKEDTDLASIRDPEALANLPEAERGSWHALWADVDTLLRPDAW